MYKFTKTATTLVFLKKDIADILQYALKVPVVDVLVDMPVVGFVVDRTMLPLDNDFDIIYKEEPCPPSMHSLFNRMVLVTIDYNKNREQLKNLFKKIYRMSPKYYWIKEVDGKMCFVVNCFDEISDEEIRDGFAHKDVELPFYARKNGDA